MLGGRRQEDAPGLSGRSFEQTRTHSLGLQQQPVKRHGGRARLRLEASGKLPGFYANFSVKVSVPSGVWLP